MRWSWDVSQTVIVVQVVTIDWKAAVPDKSQLLDMLALPNGLTDLTW